MAHENVTHKQGQTAQLPASLDSLAAYQITIQLTRSLNRSNIPLPSPLAFQVITLLVI